MVGVVSPGICKCPNCDTVGRHLVSVERITTSENAGGKTYSRTSYLGHYKCRKRYSRGCGTAWTENFS